MFSWSLESEEGSVDNLVSSTAKAATATTTAEATPVNPIDITSITIPQEDLPVEYPVEKRGLYNRNYYKDM